MLNTFISQFLRKLQEYKTIAIFVHIQPDFDAYASAFGLRKWLLDNFEELQVHLMIPKGTIKDEEKFLFDYEFNLPLPEDLKSSLGIVLDTPSTKRILTQLHSQCKELIIIDHHPKESSFSELEFVDPTYPAVSQILAEIFFKLEETKNFLFSEEIAQFFYSGIITDTNNFMSLSMLPSTYLTLSKLVSKGINRDAIHKFVFVRSLNYKLFNNRVLDRAKLTPNSLIYSIVTPKLIDKYKMHNLPNFVNMLENIANIEVWSVLSYDSNNKSWKCSIRSKTLSINHIARLYGGGGHKTMAAVSFKNKFSYYKLLVTLDLYMETKGFKNKSSDQSRNSFLFKVIKILNLQKKI